jgi:hypothetical protein
MKTFNDDRQRYLEFHHNSSVEPKTGEEYLYVEGLFRVNVRVYKMYNHEEDQHLDLECLEDCELGKKGHIFHVFHNMKYENQLYKFWPKED